MPGLVGSCIRKSSRKALGVKEKIRIDYRDIPFYLDDIDLKLKDKTTEHILEQSFIDNEIGINRRADLLFELETLPILLFLSRIKAKLTWFNISFILKV